MQYSNQHKDSDLQSSGSHNWYKGLVMRENLILLSSPGAKKNPAHQPVQTPIQQSITKVEEKTAQTLQEKEQAAPQSSGSGSSSSNNQSSAAPKTDKESGYLDIPAFLRRQAD